MFAVNNLTIDFTGDPLFEDVSFMVMDKEKIALAGKNGAGKSTMLKIFAGLQQPTRGTISMPNEVKVGYLPQQLLTEDKRSVIEEVKMAFEDVVAAQEQIDQTIQEIGERSDYESAEYADLLEKLDDLNHYVEVMGGSTMMAEIERTLNGLGFERKDFERQTSEFSGGWRMRIELAKILLGKPDILLLDEPTNHLDIESIEWLEGFLKHSESALLLVSHDKAFLDAVTTRTIEISLGQIFDYKANYSKYLLLRAERREMQMRAYENQRKMIEETEDFIERFRYKATKAVQVQSRIKQLEKLERIEVDEVDNQVLRLKFPPAPHSGALPVNIEGLTKAFGNHVVLNNVDMQIKRGEKVAFVGKNGEGKSTLVKCIMGELPFSGELKICQGVKIGYFAQNQASLLDDKLTVFDTIDRVAVGEIRTKIRDILGAFMFGGDASDKQVKVLSGGERSRLAMIKLLLEPVNLLILDEPTNHLDIRSKDVLKEALMAFNGTVIVVSHDREFMDGLVDKVYEFGGGKIKLHTGGIKEFLRKLKQTKEGEYCEWEIRGERMEVRSNLSNDIINSNVSKVVNNGRVDYEKRKEEAKEKKRKEKVLVAVENRIDELEKSIAKIEERFATGENSAELMDDYCKAKKLLEEKMYEWEILQEE